MDFPFASFILFAIVMLYSPGPNNTMLAISGANYGYRRTLPHAVGVCSGFGAMVLLLGLGIGGLIQEFPWLLRMMNIGSVLFILWFAWRIVTSKPDSDRPETKKPPLAFWGAFAFQWINGKAWVIGLATLGKFLSADGYIRDLAAVCIIFTIIGLTSSSTWVLSGVYIRRFLNTNRRFRVFNGIMSLALIVSVALSYL